MDPKPSGLSAGIRRLENLGLVFLQEKVRLRLSAPKLGLYSPGTNQTNLFFMRVLDLMVIFFKVVHYAQRESRPLQVNILAVWDS